MNKPDVNDCVALLGTLFEDVQILETAFNGLSSHRSEFLDGRGGSSEAEYGMAMRNELRNDHRADPARCTGDENVHVERVIWSTSV